MPDRRLPTWSAVVIGLLVGALLGATLLLLRERSWRDDWHTDRQRAVDTLLAEMAADTAFVDPLPAVGSTPIASGEPIDQGRSNALVMATERAAPAVVTITVTQRVAVRDPRMHFFDRFFRFSRCFWFYWSLFRRFFWSRCIDVNCLFFTRHWFDCYHSWFC